MMVYTYTGALLIVHGFLVYKFYKCREELDPSTPWNQMNLVSGYLIIFWLKLNFKNQKKVLYLLCW